MDDYGVSFEEELPWEAGFEGDRRIVVARLGPFRRVFPQPRHYARRFYHSVHELIIEDWRIPLEPLRLGSLCTIEAALSLRFQPTFKFARARLNHIADLGGHIKASYQTLLRDAAEQELRMLETAERLEQDRARVERRIENLTHELLAMRDIQCRSQCAIEILFTDQDSLDGHAATVDGKHKPLYLALLGRRRETAERLAREQYDRQIHEHTLKLEHEERLLELLQKETELRRLKQEQETEQARAVLSAEEIRHREQIDSEIRRREAQTRHEARLRQMELEAALAEKKEHIDSEIQRREAQTRHEAQLRQMELEAALAEKKEHIDSEIRQREEQIRHEAQLRWMALEADLTEKKEQLDSAIRWREEQIRHEAQLRQMELEADLTEKSRRAEALIGVENHLHREIGLLALERQRLMLEEEIHDAKLARAKGWVINAKRRFALGESEKNPDPQDAEIADHPVKR
jgi:hypothetical protein